MSNAARLEFPAGAIYPPWNLVFEISQNLKPDSWMLIGGLMVQAHAMLGNAEIRATTDVDLLIDVFADTTHIDSVISGLQGMGFDIKIPGLRFAPFHRMMRDDQVVDVLVADHLPSGKQKAARIGYLKLMETVGGAQALERRMHVSIEMESTFASFAMPDLLGALIIKAAACSDNRNPQRHFDDAALLASLMNNPEHDAMERFLERLSLSDYRNSIILKGGALVASMIGLDSRSTMDIDTSIKGHPLTEDEIRRIVQEIAAVPIEDDTTFEIRKVSTIMDEMEYPRVRVALDALFDSMRTPLKLDFSTDDVITPGEVSYGYGLLFEEREISLLAYNLETVLAEKMETLLARSIANTRMRDYYDLYALTGIYAKSIDYALLKSALTNTVIDRGSAALLDETDLILSEIESSDDISKQWTRYQNKYDYAAAISFTNVMNVIRKLFGDMSYTLKNGHILTDAEIERTSEEYESGTWDGTLTDTIVR